MWYIHPMVSRARRIRERQEYGKERSRFLSVRVSQAEYDQLAALARYRGCGVSAAARSLLQRQLELKLRSDAAAKKRGATS